MVGTDVDFAGADPYITSPVAFEKQADRRAFGTFGVFGGTELNEKRFINNENDLTTCLSKYLDYNSPDFGKWADHTLDDFIRNESSGANENVNSIMYDP